MATIEFGQVVINPNEDPQEYFSDWEIQFDSTTRDKLLDILQRMREHVRQVNKQDKWNFYYVYYKIKKDGMLVHKCEFDDNDLDTHVDWIFYTASDLTDPPGITPCSTPRE